MKNNLEKLLKNKKTYIILGMAILITVLGIIFKPPWYRMLPLYVSLVIMMLKSNANRYNFLLGTFNSILYSIVFFSLKFYGMAAQTIIVAPISFFTFLRWNKNSYKHTTIMKSFTNLQRLLLSGATIIVWLVFAFLLSNLNSALSYIDSAVTILSLLSLGLSLLSYKEYTVVDLMAQTGTVVIMFASLFTEGLSQITYVVMNVYGLICMIKALTFSNRVYKEQQAIDNK